MLGRWDDDDDDDLVGCTAVGSVHRTPWARDLSVANTATSSPVYAPFPHGFWKWPSRRRGFTLWKWCFSIGWVYPMVNSHMTMERSTIFQYFSWDNSLFRLGHFLGMPSNISNHHGITMDKKYEMTTHGLHGLWMELDDNKIAPTAHGTPNGTTARIYLYSVCSQMVLTKVYMFTMIVYIYIYTYVYIHTYRYWKNLKDILIPWWCLPW